MVWLWWPLRMRPLPHPLPRAAPSPTPPPPPPPPRRPHIHWVVVASTATTHPTYYYHHTCHHYSGGTRLRKRLCVALLHPDWGGCKRTCSVGHMELGWQMGHPFWQEQARTHVHTRNVLWCWKFFCVCENRKHFQYQCMTRCLLCSLSVLLGPPPINPTPR